MVFSTTCRLVVALLLLAQTHSFSAFTSPLQSSSATPDESEWETIMNADADVTLNRINNSYYKSKPSFLRLSSELDLPTSKQGDDPSTNLESQTQRQLNPSKGTFTFLVILVQFTDHQDRNLPSVEHIQELCDAVGTSPINPAGSIAEYFRKQSYGQFNFNCEVRDWRLTDNTEAFYAQGQRGIVGTLEGQEFFKPVLDQIEPEEIAVDPFFFFGLDQSDTSNGAIPLIVLHSGYASESSAEDCYGASRQDRIWSQGHIGVDGGWATSDGNFAVQGYTVASALDHNDGCSGQRGAKMGIITHELFHTFRAYDLYDPTSLSSPGGIGGFDIMASPYGASNDLAYPGSASPFTKIRANWVTPIPITEDGVYEIQASANSDMVYTIEEKYPTGEYLLIENRQVADWDAELWGNGGLVIYHIDNEADRQKNPGFPGQDGWPQNGNHFQVSVVQADGRFDLERGVNDGDSGDFYLAGMSLGPGNGFTYPNTDSYQNGSITSTGITITDISASGTTMSFRVTGLSTTPTPPSPTPPSPTPPSPTPPSPTPPSPTPPSPTLPSPSPPSPTPPTPTPAPNATPTSPGPTPAPNATPTPPGSTPAPNATPIPPGPTPAPNGSGGFNQPTRVPTKGGEPSAACSCSSMRPLLLVGTLLMVVL